MVKNHSSFFNLEKTSTGIFQKATQANEADPGGLKVIETSMQVIGSDFSQNLRGQENCSRDR
jgi:hypothetical protein